jgi:ABC-2 type transport system ATP-binding protein
LLTTHYLEEAERLADRVAIIDAGRLIKIGTPSDLAGAETGGVRLRTAVPVDLEILRQLPAAAAVRHDGDGLVELETADAPQLLVEITGRLRDAGVPILELRVGSGSLEELFLRLTGEGLRE